MTAVMQTPAEAGCWVDGAWGTYAVAHLVERAREVGYDNADVIALAERHMDEHRHGGITCECFVPLTVDEYWALQEAADDVEEWLNEHCAPEGFSWGWHDGEFFLQSDAWWAEP